MITHKPVLTKEILEFMQCKDGGIYVDCTLGEGGHSEEILKRSAPSGRVFSFDCDQMAIDFAKERLKRYEDRIVFVRKNFRHIKEALREEGIESVDGILFDLGLCTRQLKTNERGFSFQNEGPLDMRMDKLLEKSAFDLVNRLPEKDLKEIIRKYGEEKWGSFITRKILKVREAGMITTTLQLAEIVKSAIPKRFHTKNIHPATRTFQGIRIAVNDELNSLRDGLNDAIDLLKDGGRICVISYHSLEDRIVKNIFRDNAAGCLCSPYPCTCNKKIKLKILTKKPVIPSLLELKDNISSRSAKLRAGMRCY